MSTVVRISTIKGSSLSIGKLTTNVDARANELSQRRWVQ